LSVPGRLFARSWFSPGSLSEAKASVVPAPPLQELFFTEYEGLRYGHRIEMELEGRGHGWTDVTEDVLDSPGINFDHGIAGAGPLDVVASTGQLAFALNNSEENSAGLLGYYSPQHSACRPGFALGIGVRYYYRPPAGYQGVDDSNYFVKKFTGRLKRISPQAGQYGERKTVCSAVDWMDEAANFRPNVATLVGKRGDEVLTTLLAAMPRQPDSVVFDVGDSVFPYALDNSRSESDPITTEIQRISQSEFGRCYIRGGLLNWGALHWEKRSARLAVEPVMQFLGTMQALEGTEDAQKIRNKAKVTAHPRRVDAGDTTVLFAKPNQSNPSVGPGLSIKIVGRYTDPTNPQARVGGMDMRTPVASTDYLMNAAADGSGADFTANFSVVAAYGANQVEYTITNNGGSAGFITKLQARGRGLYDYDPIDTEALDQASIDLIGESLIALDMPYQGDAAIAAAVAEFLVLTWVAEGPAEQTLRFIPRDVDELLLAVALGPGHPIAVMEPLTNVNAIYFIQRAAQSIEELGEKVTFEWLLQRALVQDYWQVGVAGFGELGITTVLAPL
jgi:hypothetical protein